MSRRRKANRAEAIVTGVGAIILLLLLGIMTQVLPQILKGKDTHEMMSTMMQIIVGFAILCGLVVVIGLIVWVKVRKGKK
jgi:Na+/serine symporter